LAAKARSSAVEVVALHRIDDLNER